MRLYHYNMQAVRELLNCGVNLNARNLEGHTAQDMLQGQTQVNNSMIRDLLIPRKTDLFFERLRLFIKSAREGSRISNDERNALLVVAALLITITYQVVITPPGGLWQDDKISTEAPAPAGAGPAPYIYRHYAGTAIAETSFNSIICFGIFATINYITFTLSAIMIFILLPSGYITALFKMALVHLWVSYYYSLSVIIAASTNLTLLFCIASTVLCFVLVLFAFSCSRFCGSRIKSLHLDSLFYIVYAYCLCVFLSG